MELIRKRIQELSKNYQAEVILIRRHLHAHPELSFEEFKTSNFIAAKLKEYNIPFTQGIVKTGIVALIQGRNPSKKIIALRGDMDALPITEANDCEYVSKNT